MTYFLYKTPLGHPDLTDYELPLDMFPGYELIESGEDDPPAVSGMKFDDNNRLVPVAESMPEWQILRMKAYPSVGDQLDMIWHAMDDGTLPKVEPFYSERLAVKERYPKPQ